MYENFSGKQGLCFGNSACLVSYPGTGVPCGLSFLLVLIYALKFIL